MVQRIVSVVIVERDARVTLRLRNDSESSPFTITAKGRCRGPWKKKNIADRFGIMLGHIQVALHINSTIHPSGERLAMRGMRDARLQWTRTYLHELIFTHQ